MSLGTFLVGFASVTVAFLAANWFLAGKTLRLYVVTHSLAEALVFTLFGTLWFASLGAGSWLLVFALLGLLIAGSERGLRFAVSRSGGSTELMRFAVAFAKVLAAGGLLAYFTAP